MTDEPWSVERMVRGWWAYRAMSEQRETRVRVDRREGADAVEAADAWEAGAAALMAGGPDAVDLVRALVNAAPDERALDSFGHWPTGGLIASHGAELAEMIAEVASRDERFAAALRYTWVLDESLDEAAYKVLSPWIPYLTQGSIRPPQRARPKGRRWKERGTPGVSRWGADETE